GRRSALQFRLRRKVPLTFTLNMIALGEQRIDLELNGMTIGSFDVGRMYKNYSIVLPEALLQKENRLVILCPKAKSPESMGEGEDPRVLGVNIRSIRFEETTGQPECAKSP
ncbi:MAG: hypothetical protein ABIK28_05120, partial [Planctomycetota bacterium]